jgi:hypothetical protein
MPGKPAKEKAKTMPGSWKSHGDVALVSCEKLHRVGLTT